MYKYNKENSTIVVLGTDTDLKDVKEKAILLYDGKVLRC